MGDHTIVSFKNSRQVSKNAPFDADFKTVEGEKKTIKKCR
jgi:hypothetical protein